VDSAQGPALVPARFAGLGPLEGRCLIDEAHGIELGVMPRDLVDAGARHFDRRKLLILVSLDELRSTQPIEFIRHVHLSIRMARLDQVASKRGAPSGRSDPTEWSR